MNRKVTEFPCKYALTTRSLFRCFDSSSFLVALAIGIISPNLSYGSTVGCTNSAGDTNAIQTAVSAGGSVAISGNCLIWKTINLTSAVTVSGPATLTATNSPIFAVASNHVSISGLTFSGATAVVVYGGEGSVNQNFSFIGNTVQNTNGNDGLDLGPVMQYAAVNNNTFFSIAPNGFASYVFNGSACYPTNTCDLPGTGISGLSGWDQSTIQYNKFDLIASDAIHIGWNAISQDRYYFLTSNVSVSYNTFSRVHRISIEAQGTTQYVQCVSGTNVPANCSDTNHIYSDNFKVAGNYAHDFFQTYVNTYGYSLVTLNNQQFINNSAIANNPNVSNNSSLGYAQETAGYMTLSQGNVYAADYFNSQAIHGWSGVFTLLGGAGGPNPLATIQNNYVCTDQASNVAVSHEQYSYPTAVQYNYTANTCANAGRLTASAIQPTYIGSSTAGGSTTFNFGVASPLSIRNVQYLIDNSTTPISTQELSDVSSTFAKDGIWLYHVTVNTSSLSGGTHTITALATDVAGASQSVSQSFSAGGAAIVQLTPASLSFGSQVLGTTSQSQPLTLSNVGTAPLSISSIQFVSAGSTDFSPTSNCSSTLAPGSSCNVNIQFSPSTTALQTGAVVVAHNAAGSPSSTTVSGMGTAPAVIPSAASSSSLPTTLPSGMLLWLANDAGVVATHDGHVSMWQDQSGNGCNAVQSSIANQPVTKAGSNSQSALHFDGQASFMSIASLPISGLTAMSVFVVSANTADESAGGFGLHALLNWPETAAWGWTFFSTYQTSSHFRFGTTQSGNENAVLLSPARGTSFGLSEWFHNSSADSMWFNEQPVAYVTGKLQTITGVGDNAFLGLGANQTFYAGDVSEIILYGRQLSDVERRGVESYLKIKYAL